MNPPAHRSHPGCGRSHLSHRGRRHLVNQSLQVSVCGLLVVASLAQAVGVRPNQWLQAAQDLASLSETLRELDRCEHLSDAMDQQRDGLFRRYEARRQVVAALVERRLTLPEAAARFQKLNREVAGEPAQMYFPGRTEAERVCRHVISWTYGHLRGPSPGLAEEVAARLDEELRQHLERCG